jgi:NhaA family Na+:H+ antiporter
LGITLFVAAAAAVGIVRLPAGVGWPAIAGAGLLGGIGFTMALFIALLAFGEGAALDEAKVGVLAASLCAAVAGTPCCARRWLRPRRRRPPPSAGSGRPGQGVSGG